MKQFVLMADIIASGEQEASSLMSSFKQVIDEVNRECKAAILSPLTITLGDEFQGIMKSLEGSVTLIILLEEKLIAHQVDFQLRYVLNEGEIETDINTERAYEMLGSGLTDARRKLSELKKSVNRYFFDVSNAKISEKLNKLFRLYQHFVDSWQPKDKETAAGFIAGLDYKELAKKLNKDDSSVWRRKRSLAIEEYTTCKSLIMEAIND